MPKITSLPPAGSVTSDDYCVIVNAPGSTPVTQYATLQALRTSILGAGSSYTATDPITAGAASFTTLAASGDFAIATSKFTVASATGNTVVAGTLDTAARLSVEKDGSDTLSAANAGFRAYDFSLGVGLYGQQKVGSPYEYVLQVADPTFAAYFPLSINPLGGALLVGGAATFASTVGAAGKVTSTVSGGTEGFSAAPTTGTDLAAFSAINTGGSLYVGLDNSAAGSFGTAGNYGTVIFRPAATAFAISRTTTVDLHISTTGVVKIPNLAGTGTRNVVVDANGVLSAP